MSYTTQYIGSRYVPVFADPEEWNNTRTYEPLTIVLNEGNSFTSKQYVPSGIDINNKDYWAETGNYNAQIEQYRKEVLTFEERINDIEKETSEILPFDAEPTDGSNKGVTSNGIFNAITAETTRAKAAEETNANAITAETTRAKAAEETNANAITAETTRAKAAEETNANAITAINSKLNSKLNSLCFRTIEEFNVLTTNDAETNNTNFVNALQKSADENFFLIIPDKTYNLTGNIALPSNTKLIGMSSTKSELKFTSGKGFYCTADENGYACVHGVTLSNFKLIGDYDLSQTITSDDSLNKYGLMGQFFGSTVEKLYFYGFGIGIYLQFPNFQNNDYNNYNAKYGDVRLFNNISIINVYHGIWSSSPDNYFETINIARTYGRPFNIWTSNVLNNIHIWGFGLGNIIKNSKISNLEIESPEPGRGYNNNVNYILSVGGIAQLNNVNVWNLYVNNDESTTNSGFIYLTDKDTKLIAKNVTIGRNNIDTQLKNYLVTSTDNCSFIGDITLCNTITQATGFSAYPVSANGFSEVYTNGGFNSTVNYNTKYTLTNVLNS